MATIIGRKKEMNELQMVYESGRSEFVVVYGRWRVGKTYLVREFFKDRMTFYHTALSPVEFKDADLVKQQITAFCISLHNHGAVWDRQPEDWFEAFGALRTLLTEKRNGERMVVFIDEMPWMDTEQSGFVTAFESFWNGWGAGQDDLMLIVCGSATSWISDKLLNNHGGLYGRTTSEIQVSPFSLAECEEYYKSKGVVFDRYDQLQCYMALGGVPYYISYLRKDLSLAQNIDNLFFVRKARFSMEFDRLCSSQFINSEKANLVLRLLSQKRMGFTRKEIAEKTGLPLGGKLSELLESLIASDFVRLYTYSRGSKREKYYKLCDMFCLFWMYFIAMKQVSNPTFWQNNVLSPSLNAWRGFAFEEVCFVHTDQVLRALGVAGVQVEIGPWRSKALMKVDPDDASLSPEEQTTDSTGAQIDMLIERADRVANLCEIKFTAAPFVITKRYDAELRHKIQTFLDEYGKRCTPHLTLITTYGLARNEYSGHVQSVVTMDALFC